MDEEPALGFRIELHMFRHEVGPNGLYCFSAVPCDENLPAIVKKRMKTTVFSTESTYQTSETSYKNQQQLQNNF